MGSLESWCDIRATMKGWLTTRLVDKCHLQYSQENQMHSLNVVHLEHILKMVCM